MTDTLSQAPTGQPQNFHPIKIGDQEFLTNMPEGVNPFGDNNLMLPYVDIRPVALDAVPVGDFVVKEKTDPHHAPRGFESKPHQREIVLYEGPKGRVAGNIVFELATPRVTPNSAEIMRSVGYDIVINDRGDHAFVDGVPVPETFAKAAKEQGVEVRFFKDYNRIPPEPYVQTFADGMYPVALGGEYDYIHDINDDHITAMILGGELLKTTLMTAAKQAINTSEGALKNAAGAIDGFTATLRAIVSPANLAGEAYGEKQGRKTLLTYATVLGIDAKTVDAIIETAQEKARSFGMEISPLA